MKPVVFSKLLLNTLNFNKREDDNILKYIDFLKNNNPALLNGLITILQNLDKEHDYLISSTSAFYYLLEEFKYNIQNSNMILDIVENDKEYLLDLKESLYDINDINISSSIKDIKISILDRIFKNNGKYGNYDFLSLLDNTEVLCLYRDSDKTIVPVTFKLIDNTYTYDILDNELELDYDKQEWVFRVIKNNDTILHPAEILRRKYMVLSYYELVKAGNIIHELLLNNPNAFDYIYYRVNYNDKLLDEKVYFNIINIYNTIDNFGINNPQPMQIYNPGGISGKFYTPDRKIPSGIKYIKNGLVNNEKEDSWAKSKTNFYGSDVYKLEFDNDIRHNSVNVLILLQRFNMLDKFNIKSLSNMELSRKEILYILSNLMQDNEKEYNIISGLENIRRDDAWLSLFNQLYKTK